MFAYSLLQLHLHTYIIKMYNSRYVTGFWKTVPNHTFLFQYIYHWHMDTITFSIIFLRTTWIFNAQITERMYEILSKYICIREISLNTCRNTLDFMCDFEQIRSHIIL